MVKLLLCATLLYSAHAASVPFVGCESFGQIERLAPPKGTGKSVAIGAADAQALAYYASGDGIGVLAPRGWYCEGASGSGGAALFLGPKPIGHGSAGWTGLEGPAMELDHRWSDGSGRYDIAEIMARIFPVYRASASRFLKEMGMPIPAGPFASDTLARKSSKIVEYRTPPHSEGLGNFHSWLGKNQLPIAGVAMIVDTPGQGKDGPDLILLSVRLPPSSAHLIPVIVHELEHR
jgi:hypothetical protein